MTTPACVRCAKPTADGYACTGCTGHADKQLRRIADRTPDARDASRGQTGRGLGASGGGSRGRIELDLSATARLDSVQNALTTWARHALEHGRQLVHARDPIVSAALTIAANLEWFRHRQEVEELLPVVDRAASVVTGIVDRPTGSRYLGPCEMPTADDDLCTGDVWARDGAPVGHCRACRAEHDTAERRRWLDGHVRSRSFRAAHIEQAFGIRANTIVKWAARGRLVPDLDPLPDGVHGPWPIWEDEQGRRRYPLGDVLDLAEQDARKRAEQAEKRARAENEAA